jgi:hypothetical protein
MDTSTFLRTILPEEGIKFVARWFDVPNHPRGGIFMHKPFVDIDDMANNIQWHAEKGNTIYHACATFKEVLFITTKAGKEVPAGRTQANAATARSLWMDFDVKPGVEGAYDSKAEVIDDLKKLKRETGLPVPMIIDSGNGIHAYFLLENEVEKSEWLPLAAKLRTVLDHLGIKHDPSRTCDMASILRPAGSFNLKNPEKPKTVKCVKEGERVESSVIESALDTYIEANELFIQPVGKKDSFAGLNSDLMAEVEYPDSFASIIVSHCQQVQEFSQTGGKDEPTWYAMLGLLKHCSDGEQYAHEWGSLHADYDEETTSTKMDQWDFGPSTCEKFRSCNPSACEGCQHSCTSPIQLGQSIPENVAHTPLVIREEAVEQAKVISHGPGSVFWPRGYSVLNGAIYVARENDDGTYKNAILVEPVFWLIDEVKNEKGENLFHMRSELRDGKIEDFDIPMSAAASPDTLKKALAANRIWVKSFSPRAGGELMSLIQEQALTMQKLKDEMRTYSQMGWDKSGEKFLIGNKLIHKGGISEVRAGESITNLTSKNRTTLESKGDIARYKELVTKLYGAEDQVAYRYVLGATIGSYVSPLIQSIFDEWHGIPLLVYSSESGFGKTTVVAAGLNAVCHNSFSRSSTGTRNFFQSILEVYGSMPVFIDEISGQFDPFETQQFLYAWPTGCRKGRLGSDGSIKDRGDTWCNMGFVTSNESMLHKLGAAAVDPQATQVRLIELDLAEYTTTKPTLATKPDADELTTEVYGVASEALIKLIVKNRDKLEEAMRAEYKRIFSHFSVEHSSLARFMICHAVCTVMGVKLGNKLGLFEFDASEVREFAIRHIKSQLSKVMEYQSTPEDLFSAMMADMANKMIVTTRFDTLDSRKKDKGEFTEQPLFGVNNTAIVGRYAIGCSGTKSMPMDSGRLYISVHAIGEWAKANKMSGADLRMKWANAGLIEMNRGAKNGEKQVRLNKGLAEKALPPTRCLEFVVSKVRGYVAELEPKPAEVRQLSEAA